MWNSLIPCWPSAQVHNSVRVRSTQVRVCTPQHWYCIGISRTPFLQYICVRACKAQGVQCSLPVLSVAPLFEIVRFVDSVKIDVMVGYGTRSKLIHECCHSIWIVLFLYVVPYMYRRADCSTLDPRFTGKYLQNWNWNVTVDGPRMWILYQYSTRSRLELDDTVAVDSYPSKLAKFRDGIAVCQKLKSKLVSDSLAFLHVRSVVF